MANNSGSNTRNQPGEIRSFIDTSDGGMAIPNEQLISQPDTASPKTNTTDGSSSENSSPTSPSKPSDNGWNRELETFPIKLLPERARAIAQAAAGMAHFTAWIPNALTTAITIDSIVELPPGSTLIFVFPENENQDLPTHHETGKAYIIE